MRLHTMYPARIQASDYVLSLSIYSILIPASVLNHTVDCNGKDKQRPRKSSIRACLQHILCKIHKRQGEHVGPQLQRSLEALPPLHPVRGC